MIGATTRPADVETDMKPSEFTSQRNVLLIAHLNRSGSTMLANGLSRNPAFAVCPEAGVLAAIRRNAAEVGHPLESREVTHLVTDEKLSSWQLDIRDLAGRFPRYSDFLLAVLNTYADSVAPNSRCVVFKGTLGAMKFFDLLRSRLPGRVKLVYMVRDPRGTFVSQARSASSKTGLPMQSSPARFAAIWRRFVRQAFISLEHDPEDVRILRYEDVVPGFDVVLRDLAAWLGVPDQHGSSDSMNLLSQRIPEAQRHLHANIDGPPLLDHVTRWKEEIRPYARRAIERICGREMELLQYGERQLGLSGIGVIGEGLAVESRAATTAIRRRLKRLTGLS